MTTAPATTHPIFDALVGFFDSENWATTRLADETILQMAFQGRSHQWMCFAQAREDLGQIVFYSVAPVVIPPEKRLAVAEFITRANYGLIIGNFEMDFQDGEFRYKTSLDLEGVVPVPALFAPLVYANVATMDRYLPGLMAVLYGSAAPAGAIDQVEAQSDTGA
jgi:hypothetical protein